MKKNKNKMIGMSTGFTLRSMKDLYCNNSIIKTGTMIAGVMLASCTTDRDNNNAKKDETNKTDKINLSALKDDVKNNLATQLGTDVNGLQTKIDELDLTPKDIDEEGKLTESGLQKTKAKEPVATDPNDKTIDLSKLIGDVKTKLAGHLGVKEEKLQDEINGLKLDKDDINETTGELKDSGLQKKKEAEDGKMAEALKFLGENKEKFITYLDDLDSYFGNQKGKFAADIKDKEEEAIKKQVTTLCEFYSPYKKDKDDVAINISNIIKGLQSNKCKFIEKKIAASIDEATFDNKVNYKCIKNGDNQIKVTVQKEGKEVTFDLGISADELCSLKTTAKDGKDSETKLYRITIEIDGDLPVDDLTKLLVPKTKEEIKDEAENKIKEVLAESIKTNNKIAVNNFKELADTLKKLVEATQKLLIGKYNDNTDEKFLADVKDSKVLYDAFGKTEYVNAIKTEFDAQLDVVKKELANVNSGELTEKIIISSIKLVLNDQQQALNGQNINDVITDLLDSSKKGTNVIEQYIDATSAKITVNDKCGAELEIHFANGEKFDKDGIVAFDAQDNVGKDQITNINNLFKTTLENKIDTLYFGTLGTVDCKKHISDDYIKNQLTFDNVSKNTSAAITEASLRTACGKDNIVIATVDDVKNHIVVPVMNKVFGDDKLVKAVFTKVKQLLALEVGGTNGNNKKTLVADGLASIGKDDDGNASVVTNNINVNTNSFGTATRLKTALLDIRKAILDYNSNGTSTKAVQDFFEFYFGKVGTGKITVMTDGADVPNDLEWMRLGKAVAKWVFSNQNSQDMKGDYDAASKALAMSILLKNVHVKSYVKNNGGVNIDSSQLEWWNTEDGNHLKLNLMGSTNKGVGGSAIQNIVFDNMIICNKLKTNTSSANNSINGNIKDTIVIPKLASDNSWNDAQIVDKKFANNFDGNDIKSDFALLALFLGYFNINGEMIDIQIKTAKQNDQYIHLQGIKTA